MSETELDAPLELLEVAKQTTGVYRVTKPQLMCYVSFFLGVAFQSCRSEDFKLVKTTAR